jgi:hypothetical protein
MKTLLFTFILVLVTVCNGQAQINIVVPPAGSEPTNLALLIARADHIIITNRAANQVPKYRGFSLLISGPRVSKIVAAVSSAKRNQAETDSEWDWEMQFFRATNYLATVDFQGRMFLAENGEYEDQTGELDRLYTELLHRTTPRQEW